jgi:hypothetical protein
MASTFELPNNSVSVDKDDVIIVVTARGTETREAVANVGEKVEAYASELRSRSAKVLVIIDARTEKLENSTKEGRAEFRRLASKLDVDAYAFVGDERLQTLMRYATRSFGRKVNLEFFSSMNKAKEWLLSLDGVTPRPHKSRWIIVAGLVLATLIIGLFIFLRP